MLCHLPTKWRARRQSDEPDRLLHNRLDGSDLVKKLSSVRGDNDPQTIQSFLEPDESQFHNPYDLAESEPAARQILEAVGEERRIVLLGEHSLDGQLSIALLYRLLNPLHDDLDYAIVDENGPSKQMTYPDGANTLTVVIGQPPGLERHLNRIQARDESAIILGRRLSHFCGREKLTVVDPLGKASRYINHSVPIAGITLKVGEIVLRKKYGEEPPNFVAVDLETTGTAASQDEIIEIGAVRYRAGKPVEEFQTFVSSVSEVPDLITELTGLTAEHLEGAPRPAEALRQFTEFLDGELLVAHNAPFDAGFLHFSMKKYRDQSFLNHYDDSKELARKQLPEMPEHGLKHVCKRLGVDMGTHHRALDDAYSCGEIYVQLRSSNPGPIKNFRRRYLPFVALAALGEQSPVSPENRAMTRIGLDCLDRSPFEGFSVIRRTFQRILRESFGLLRGPLTVLRLAAQQDQGTFLIRLLGEPDPDEQWFERLDVLSDRWRTEKEVVCSEVQNNFPVDSPSSACVWIEIDEIDPYLIDAEISKLSDDLDRCVCVISPNADAEYECFLRTPEPVDLQRILDEFDEPMRLRNDAPCSARFLSTISDLSSLQQRIEEKLGAPADAEWIQPYDLELDAVDLNRISLEELSRLGPFGPGNPRPRFRMSNVTVRETEACGPGGKDLKLKLEQNGEAFEARAPFVGKQASALRRDRSLELIMLLSQVNGTNKQTRPHVLVIDFWENGPGGESNG